MFSIADEELLSITEAARSLPAGPSGKTPHPSTLWRWIKRGVRDVRLETVRIGGLIYTSRQALQRFAERCSRPRVDTVAKSGRFERAEDFLADEGFPKRGSDLERDER